MSKNTIDREIINGVVKYYKTVVHTKTHPDGMKETSKIKTPTTALDILKEFTSSNNKPPFSYKQLLDDLDENDYPMTLYTFAFYKWIEEVKYLMNLGADPKKGSTNGSVINLVYTIRNNDKKGIELFNIISEEYTVDYVKDNLFYMGNYDLFEDSYAIMNMFVNKNLIPKELLDTLYPFLSTKAKRQLSNNCPLFTELVLEKGDEKFYPNSVKDIFIF